MLPKSQNRGTNRSLTASTALVQTLFCDKGGTRRQLGRRLSEEQVQRSIGDHFRRISRKLFGDQKIRGLVLRDRIRQDKVNVKQHTVSVSEFSQDVEAVLRLEPSDPKETVSQTFVEALDIATSTNLSMRSTETSQTSVQHCDELIDTELIGLRKVESDHSMLGIRMWMGFCWIF